MGKYIGEVVVKWPKDRPRVMILAQEIAYVDGNGTRWVAPTGSEIDGASIPRLFWRVVGSPYVGMFRYASVIHDVYCQHKRVPHRQVHAMFNRAMKDSGVSNWKRKAMFRAVWHFGPKW